MILQTITFLYSLNDDFVYFACSSEYYESRFNYSSEIDMRSTSRRGKFGFYTCGEVVVRWLIYYLA